MKENLMGFLKPRVIVRSVGGKAIKNRYYKAKIAVPDRLLCLDCVFSRNNENYFAKKQFLYMSLIKLAKKAGEVLANNKLLLVSVESCTGGLVAKIITDMPGSSKWFERGYVTYSNNAKEDLGVKPETLAKYGAVSEQTAKEMAEGSLLHSHAQISLAVTGIAGPSGGTENKPVGTVCFAWAANNFPTKTTKHFFLGNRDEIRQQAVEFVLKGLIDFALLCNYK